MLEYKTSVQQVEKVIETTGSRPVIVTDEQLDDYACKYDFTEKLIKEYIAHYFLKIWELPVLPAAFVRVLPEHINPAILKKGIISSRTQPRHFNKLCFGTLYNVDAIVYNGDTGPAKTDDSGPAITVINGPLFMYNYKCLILMAQLFFSSKRFSLQFDTVRRENHPVQYGISGRTFSN